MLEVVLDRHIMVILMVIAAAVGVVSKAVAGISLKRLVRAAGNMNKSGHPLIRLVKAKFEHACMVSDRVQNVEVFVEKYLYEYRAAGLKLHTWRRLEKAGVWLCLIFGLAGAGAQYAVYGMSDPVLRYAAAGAGGAILVFLFQLTSDEKYQLSAIRNYMVDYLENVCARRYEKTHAGKIREEWRAMAPPDTELKYGAGQDRKADREYGTAREQEADREYGTAREQEADREYGMTREQETDREYGMTREQRTDRGYGMKQEAGTEPAQPVNGSRAREAQPEAAQPLQAAAEQGQQSGPEVVLPEDGIQPEILQPVKEQKPETGKPRTKGPEVKKTEARGQAESRKRQQAKEDVPKEVRIREILEEFLA